VLHQLPCFVFTEICLSQTWVTFDIWPFAMCLFYHRMALQTTWKDLCWSCVIWSLLPVSLSMLIHNQVSCFFIVGHVFFFFANFPIPVSLINLHVRNYWTVHEKGRVYLCYFYIPSIPPARMLAVVSCIALSCLLVFFLFARSKKMNQWHYRLIGADFLWYGLRLPES